MTLPRMLEDYATEALEQEIRDRAGLRAAGLCDYCRRSYTEPSCKATERHWQSRDEARQPAAAAKIEPGANLGLATTRELLAEVTARIEVDGITTAAGGLDYTTVGGKPDDSLTPVADELPDEPCPPQWSAGSNTAVAGATWDVSFREGMEAQRHMDEADTLDALAARIYANAVAHGWWEEPRNFGEVCMLICTEVAEAMEQHRHSKPAYYEVEDKHGCMEPKGWAVEFCDVIIRCLDYLKGVSPILDSTVNNLPMPALTLTQIARRKMEYNTKREYRHGGLKA